MAHVQSLALLSSQHILPCYYGSMEHYIEVGWKMAYTCTQDTQAGDGG